MTWLMNGPFASFWNDHGIESGPPFATYEMSAPLRGSCRVAGAHIDFDINVTGNCPARFGAVNSLPLQVGQ